MRIALNAGILRAPRTGIGQYLVELVHALGAYPELELRLFNGWRWQSELPAAALPGYSRASGLIKRWVPNAYALRRLLEQQRFNRGTAGVEYQLAVRLVFNQRYAELIEQRGHGVALGFAVAHRGRVLEGRDQVVLAVTDQVRPAHGLERIAQQRPVVRVVVAQEGLVQASPALALDDVDLFALVGQAADALERVQARVVHRRGRGHGAGITGAF